MSSQVSIDLLEGPSNARTPLSISAADLCITSLHVFNNLFCVLSSSKKSSSDKSEELTGHVANQIRNVYRRRGIFTIDGRRQDSKATAVLRHYVVFSGIDLCAVRDDPSIWSFVTPGLKMMTFSSQRPATHLVEPMDL